MKKNARIILTLLLCAAARAGNCANVAGTGAAAFLKLPVDARSAGMGEAVAAGPRGAMALFQNPAGLAENTVPEIAFSHALLMEDISYEVMCLAVPLHGNSVIGVGAQYLRYGSFASLDNNGVPAGSLSPRDSAFVLGYGLKLDEDVMVGGAVKSISSKISGTASGAAMDLGLLITGDEVSAGITAQNMGKGLKFDKESSPLPVNVKLGVMIPYQEKWHWAADFNFPKDGPAWLAAGAEYAFVLKAATLFGRAGYNTAAVDTKSVNGISAGFGFVRKGLTVDYAFRTMGVLGSTHHLGFTYRLGK